MFSIDGQTTIAAISSALNGAARGIVRLSGLKTQEILDRFFGRSATNSFVAVTRPGCYSVEVPLGEGRVIPGWLYLWPNERSYTGEPSAEIHTLGSLPVLNRILERLLGFGAVPAQGGEFTFRAFLSGKLDLTQAEAVLGLIEASDEQGFRTAAAQLSGGFSKKLNQLRDRILDALVQLEAGFDFSEEDISFISADELKTVVDEATRSLDSLLAQLNDSESSTRLIRVVLCGNPNVGKSSLFNALLDRSAAIVSPVQGSTRDYLTQTVSWSGLEIQLIDTAGRESNSADPLTQASVPTQPLHLISVDSQNRASEQTRQAQIRLLCLRKGEPLFNWQRELLADRKVGLIVYTQTDRDAAYSTPSPDGISSTTNTEASSEWFSQIPSIETSSVTGQGIADLKARIVSLASHRNASETEILASTSSRCRLSLQEARDALDRARRLLDDLNSFEEDLVAEEIHSALNALGTVVGAVYTDDILNGVFGRFCVGK